MTGGTAVQPGQQAEVAEGASLHSCDVEGLCVIQSLAKPQPQGLCCQ